MKGKLLMVLAAGLLGGCATPSGKALGPAREVGPAEARALVASGQAVPVDVRSPFEYDGGHIPGAVMVPFGSKGMDSKVRKAARGRQALVYCRTGNQSGAALAELAGVPGVLHLEGGIVAWKAAGGELEGRSAATAGSGLEIKEHKTDVYRFSKRKGESKKLSEVYHFF